MLKQRIILNTVAILCIGMFCLLGCKNEAAENAAQEVQQDARELAADTRELAALGKDYFEEAADKAAKEVKLLKDETFLAANNAKVKAMEFEALTEAQVVELADTGDSAAQYYVGTLYAEGKRGFAQSQARAAEYYQMAADNGYYAAQYKIAELYRQGAVPAENKSQKIVDYMTKAADQGYDLAQFGLGKMYYAGEGVAKDFEEAFTWCKKAADQGLGEAQLLVGHMYAKGEGVEQDYEKAATYFSMAIHRGVAGAEQALDDIKLNLTLDQLKRAEEAAKAWLEDISSQLW